MKKLLTIGLILLISGSCAGMQKLKELAAQATAQEVIKAWNKAWQETPQNIAAVISSINSMLAATPPEVVNLLVGPLFEAKKEGLFQLFLKKPIGLVEDKDGIDQFVFDPRGEFIYTSSGEPNGIKVWNASTYQEIRTLTDDGIMAPPAIKVSTDGAKLAYYAFAGNRLVIVNRDDNFSQVALETPEISEANFDPQGSSLVVTYRDRIEIRDMTGTLPTEEEYPITNTLPLANIEIEGATENLQAFSSIITADGQFIVTVAQNPDENYRCLIWPREKWNVQGAKPRVITFGRTTGYTTATDPNGKWIALALEPHFTEQPIEFNATLIDLKNNLTLDTLRGPQAPIRYLKLNNAGTLLAAAAGNLIYLWDLEKDFALTTLAGHEGDVQTLSFSPDDSLLFSTAADETIRVWDIKNQRANPLIVIPGHEGESRHSIKFHPNGYIFGCAAEEMTALRLWFAPSPDMFNFDQFLVLLAFARVVQNPDALSQEAQQALAQSIMLKEGFTSLPELIRKHLQAVLAKTIEGEEEEFEETEEEFEEEEE